MASKFLISLVLCFGFIIHDSQTCEFDEENLEIARQFNKTLLNVRTNVIEQITKNPTRQVFQCLLKNLTDILEEYKESFVQLKELPPPSKSADLKVRGAFDEYYEEMAELSKALITRVQKKKLFGAERFMVEFWKKVGENKLKLQKKLGKGKNVIADWYAREGNVLVEMAEELTELNMHCVVTKEKIGQYLGVVANFFSKLNEVDCTQDFYGGVSHQLSATRLLSSPEGSRHPLDGLDHQTWTWGDSFSSLHRDTAYTEVRTPRPAFFTWGCFRGCKARIYHSLAKRKVDQGVRLYNQHKQQQAVRKWKSALKAIRKREDKFELLGYLYQAYIDWGKYRDALEFAHKQLYISEELDNPNMRAESYLNLARAHQRLGGLERALAYARHSLYNDCEQCATAGHVHLTVGSVYLELAGFNKALDSFQHAHRIAQAVNDNALELQVYVGLSELFSRLQDADKSARYASKAYDLSRSLQLGDLNSRHHRAALLQMASALRKQGELGDAHDYCSEATRLALVSGDQATYARSIRIMGDIYRKKLDINKAFRQYETAMGSAAAMGDRVIQMESMDGAARCLEALRLQHKICNCRPLEFNTRLLEVASSVGAKLLVRTIRLRLSKIYHSLGDEDQKLHHERVANRLQQDLDLTCGGCGSPYGLENDSLEALPCAHILHARCAYDILKRNKKKKRSCPDCDKAMNSRLYLNCNDYNNTYSPVALSVCSSESHCGSHQATSSV